MSKRNEELDKTWTAVPHASAPSTRHAFLLVLSGPQFGDIFPLDAGREVVIGRREDADLQLQDDGVSRRHASIRVVGTHALLKDLASANGTWADELEARWQMKIAEGALQDSLTGLFNRRHFEERLSSELAAAQRHGRALSLLLVDVDHFKNVTDQFGHLAGDEALKMVAFVLRGTVRKEDVVARYGGEEFVVLARETALQGGRALAERIRKAVERSRCAWQGRDLGLTVSIGVTISVGLTEFIVGKSDRELLESADRALYLAKQAGRNRVIALTVGGAAPPSKP